MITKVVSIQKKQRKQEQDTASPTRTREFGNPTREYALVICPLLAAYSFLLVACYLLVMTCLLVTFLVIFLLLSCYLLTACWLPACWLLASSS